MTGPSPSSGIRGVHMRSQCHHATGLTPASSRSRSSTVAARLVAHVGDCSHARAVASHSPSEIDADLSPCLRRTWDQRRPYGSPYTQSSPLVAARCEICSACCLHPSTHHAAADPPTAPGHPPGPARVPSRRRSLNQPLPRFVSCRDLTHERTGCLHAGAVGAAWWIARMQASI